MFQVRAGHPCLVAAVWGSVVPKDSLSPESACPGHLDVSGTLQVKPSPTRASQDEMI